MPKRGSRRGKPPEKKAAPPPGQPTLEEAIERKRLETVLTCEICFEKTLGTQTDTTDTSLGCAEGHLICFGCVRKILTAHDWRCSPNCVGLQYKCPYCRATCCVGRVNQLSLTVGSHSAARGLFDCGCTMRRWAEATYMPKEDEEA